MRLSTLLCWFGFLLTATAQEKVGRTCRIVFLMAPEDAPRTLQLYDGTSSQEVELPSMNLSKVYQLPAGPLKLRLLHEAPAKPEAVNPVAPSVDVAAEVMDCYLLVAADSANPVVPVRMSLINAGKSIFKDGQMLWFNLSDKTVGGKVGSQNLSLAPNARNIMDPPGSGRGDYDVNLAYLMPGDDKLRPVCKTKWYHDPACRTVLFVVNEPGTRTPRVIGFPDRRSKVKVP